jgi:hypothetical protein
MTDDKEKKTSSKNNIFVGFMNPLSFFKMEPIPGQKSEEVTMEDILGYLCSETTIPEIDNFKKSYKHISEHKNKLFIVPNENKILNKLIFPLKHAIGSYMIGNYLGTIAICGIVCEMTIIFHYETLKIKINKQDSEEAVKKLYGQSFEKLSQDRRVKFLQVMGFLRDELVEQFDIVRKCRNAYLHSLSKEHENIAPDAKKAFDATVEIVQKILGVGISPVTPGSTIMNQNVIDYLISKGLAEKGRNE